MQKAILLSTLIILLVCCKKNADSETVLIHVAEHTVKGSHILSPSSMSDYLWVYENNDTSNRKTLYLDQIQGFNYEVGNRYVLKATKYTIPDPPQDGSSIGYKLIEVISKIPIK